MRSLRPTRWRRSTDNPWIAAAISSSTSYSAFERIAMTRPPGRTDASSLGQCCHRVGDELQHPHEVGRVDGSLRQWEGVDVGHSYSAAQPIDGGTKHRVAEVEADRLDAVSPQPAGDHPGADPEFHDRRPDDPRRQGVGESVAASLPAPGRVVDRRHLVERRTGHVGSV